MYARQTAGRQLTFDFAEGLIRDNLLLVDRETSSVWSQLDNKAVSGPLKGTPMQVVPSLQTTWKFWREQHPDSLVAVVEDEQGRPYYYSDFKPGARRPRPTAHDPSTLGLGLAVGQEAWYFPLSELAGLESPLRMEADGQPVQIHHRTEALTAWAEDSQGSLLAGVLAYRQGWLSFFPDSQIYQAPSQEPSQ